MTKQHGFTLIELMIVVAIIAILASIALPAYQDYTIRSQVSECPIVATFAKTAVSETLVNDGALPGDNAEAGLPAANTIVGKYISEINVLANGVIECTFSSTSPRRANVLIDTKTLRLTPTIPGNFATAGSLVWTCSSISMAERYLPTMCRP
jgi:type IV pilus assembly protein PilA